MSWRSWLGRYRHETAVRAGVVGAPEEFSRNWSYTALSRRRAPTAVYLVDERADVGERQEYAPAEQLDGPPALERLAVAMRRRDDEALALDRLDAVQPAPLPGAHEHAPLAQEAGADRLDRSPAAGPFAGVSTEQLWDELARLELPAYPRALAAELDAVRAQRVAAEQLAAAAEGRAAQLKQQTTGVLRRRPADPAGAARDRATAAHATQQARELAGRERDLAARVPERRAWEAEHRQALERGAALRGELDARTRQDVHDALQSPGTHLEDALGPRPTEPGARRTWDHAAQRLEAYRFTNRVDGRDALGPRPDDSTGRAAWERAQRDLQRTQRQLGREPARQRDLGHGR